MTDRWTPRAVPALDGFASPARSHTPGTRLRVAVVLGTRPEAIKLAPVVRELERRADVFAPLVVATAQHREMLAQALDAFGLRPDVDLGLMREGQTPGDFLARAIEAVGDCLRRLAPDVVLVQGDTSTVLAAALAAVYERIPVGHVEAGLRSFNVRSPFPEELNRRLATAASELHFAPTWSARQNLLAEGIAEDRVFVTGNTVVDALAMTPRKAAFDDPALDRVPWGARRVILVTVHRGENLGAPLAGVCAAIRELVRGHADVHVVLPVHLNPAVRDVVRAELGDVPRVTLLEPIGHSDFLEAARRSTFVMTDSGGVQEECPSLGRAVLILRENTERPEVVDAGFGRLVGTDATFVASAASRLLDDPAALHAMSSGRNPFGDGLAARRIVDVLARRLAGVNDGPAIPEFAVGDRLVAGGVAGGSAG